MSKEVPAYSKEKRWVVHSTKNSVCKYCFCSSKSINDDGTFDCWYSEDEGLSGYAPDRKIEQIIKIDYEPPSKKI